MKAKEEENGKKEKEKASCEGGRQDNHAEGCDTRAGVTRQR